MLFISFSPRVYTPLHFLQITRKSQVKMTKKWSSRQKDEKMMVEGHEEMEENRQLLKNEIVLYHSIGIGLWERVGQGVNWVFFSLGLHTKTIYFNVNLIATCTEKGTPFNTWKTLRRKFRENLFYCFVRCCLGYSLFSLLFLSNVP